MYIGIAGELCMMLVMMRDQRVVVESKRALLSPVHQRVVDAMGLSRTGDFTAVRSPRVYLRERKEILSLSF